jgi:peroxiredoxin
MERLYRTFKQTDFVLLAVSMDRQGEGAARPFVDKLKLTFPILLDNTSGMLRQRAVPSDQEKPALEPQLPGHGGTQER